MSDTPDLKVVQLHAEAMAADIVGSLRRAADSIESETDAAERTVSAMFVTIGEDGAVNVYGWGRVQSRYEGMGFLQAGIAEL